MSTSTRTTVVGSGVSRRSRITVACGSKPSEEQQAPQSQQRLQINGAGATFPSPIYSKWFDEYHKLHPNVEINYQSVGSGAGIRQLSNQTVFFGASDAPMTDEQLKSAPGPVLHVPTVLGAELLYLHTRSRTWMPSSSSLVRCWRTFSLAR